MQASYPFSQVFAVLPVLLMGLLYYALIFFCIWKFYQLLSNINDNLAAMSRNIAAMRPPAPLSSQPCPRCGAAVLPTADGRCPACQATLG